MKMILVVALAGVIIDATAEELSAYKTVAFGASTIDQRAGSRARLPYLLWQKDGRSFYVHVYNYAHVADGVLARAEQEAARPFRQAGVEPIWVACPLSQEEIERYPQCHETRGLILNIRPEFGLKTAQRNHEFGFAVNTTAYVFEGSLRGIVQSGVASWPVVLGHVIAHEIGHVLLGADSHSADGLMRFRLGPEDWRRASIGKLSFNQDQRDRLRSFLAGGEPASVVP